MFLCRIIFSCRVYFSSYLQWSSADQSWAKIGEVVDAVGQERRQLYNGREYDYVFTVDIGEGIPPLKLSYNTTGTFRYSYQ